MKQLLKSLQIMTLLLLKYCSNTEESNSKLQVQAYPSYANESRTKLRVMGRVIESNSAHEYTLSENRFNHFIQVVRLFLANGKSGEKVEVQVGGENFELQTNSQGFFNEQISLQQKAALQPPLNSSDLPTIKLKICVEESSKRSCAQTYAVTPSQGCKKIIISDIDDTILKSRATSFLILAFKTLLYPPGQRKIFPDVAESYKKIQRGPLSEQNNLFIYLSSSTWDIYPLLHHFIKINQLPEGPMILQDVADSSATQMDSQLDHWHKIDRINEIIKLSDQLPLVLIGDAGQADSEIYLKIAENYPDKIDSILIRRTWWQKVSQDPTEFTDRAKALGVDFRYFDQLDEVHEQFDL